MSRRRCQELNLDKTSYGLGLRVHTERTTFARLDVAHGTKGGGSSSGRRSAASVAALAPDRGRAVRALISGKELRWVVVSSSFLSYPALLAMYLPFCAASPADDAPPDAPPASLWEEPTNLADRDLFNGPWGAGRGARSRTTSTRWSAEAQRRQSRD